MKEGYGQLTLPWKNQESKKTGSTAENIQEIIEMFACVPCSSIDI